MKLNVYTASSLHDLSLNECMISTDWDTGAQETPSAVTISPLQCNGNQITLKVHFIKNIHKNHAVVHEWVLQHLNISFGEVADIDIVRTVPCPATSEDAPTIVLEFLSACSVLNWDDMTNSPLTFPGKWSDNWPIGIKRDNIIPLLPSMLCGVCVTDGQFLALSVLSNYVVFRCTLQFVSSISFSGISPPTWYISACSSVKYVISIPDHIPDSTDVQKSTSIHILPFLQPCYHSAMLLIQEILQHSAEWRGPHTQLLIGPKGAGKTHLLHLLSESLSKDIEPPSCILTLHPNLTAISEEANVNYYDNSVPLLVKLVMQFVATFGELPMATSHCYSAWKAAALQQPANPPPLVLLLENLDDCLASLRVKEEISTSNISSVQSLRSIRLRELLSLLSQPTFKDPVCIIATTRLAESDVSSNFLGPPGFEVTSMLPSPAQEDRQHVISSMLYSLTTTASSQQKGYVLGDLPRTYSDDFGNSMEEKDLFWHWTNRMSHMTAGYLPGDLGTVIRRMRSIRDGKARAVGLSLSGSVTESSTTQVIEWKDFLEALTMTPPSQLQALQSDLPSGGGVSVEGRNSSLKWDDFAGYMKEKAAIKSVLKRYSGRRISEDSSLNLDALQPRGLVLWGPSGCGKSFLSRVIAAEANMNFITVRSPALLSKYFGQTEASLRNLFRKARSAAPCVLFFDDFDAIAHNRGSFDPSRGNSRPGGDESSESGVTARVLSTFLNELDGITSGNSGNNHAAQVFVLTACADVEALDKALLRPGRLSHKILIDRPSPEDIKQIISSFLQKVPVDEHFSVEDILHTIPSCTCAEISAICRNALKNALNESIHSSREKGGIVTVNNVSRKHFLNAVSAMYPAPMKTDDHLTAERNSFTYDADAKFSLGLN